MEGWESCLKHAMKKGAVHCPRETALGSCVDWERTEECVATPYVCGELSSETEQLLCWDLQKVSPCPQHVQNSKRKGKRAGRKGRKATEVSK